eukprot:6431421-Pyramimonas_sp.AAC.1
MEAFLAALPQRPRGAPQGSPGTISRSRDSLRSPGFGRYQVGKKNLDGPFTDFWSVDNFVLEIPQFV